MSSAPTDSFSALELGLKGDFVVMRVAARPGASKNAILGVHDGALRVAVAAAPEKGKANKELLAFLAKTLGIKKDSLELSAGEASRDKRVLIQGLSAEDLRRRLSEAAS